jgi:hypothetical protein
VSAYCSVCCACGSVAGVGVACVGLTESEHTGQRRARQRRTRSSQSALTPPCNHRHHHRSPSCTHLVCAREVEQVHHVVQRDHDLG